MADASLERLLRRDRLVVAAALTAITLLAWAYVVYLSLQMKMGGMDMSGFRMAVAAAGMVMTPSFQPWSGSEFVFTTIMWVVMMIGMMTPSAAPIILLYVRVGRQAAGQGRPFASAAWFAGGYILAWTAFGLAATAAQWGLDRAALLTPMMAASSTVVGSIVLIAAGAYQWTPFKDRCLSHCQSPLQFIFRHGGFRSGVAGSLQLGMSHGVYCVGCCWAMMALLFVVGVMNAFWIAVISMIVLAEKLIPAGRFVSRVAGIAFVFAGVWLLYRRGL